jgi:hypothetical protein
LPFEHSAFDVFLLACGLSSRIHAIFEVGDS